MTHTDYPKKPVSTSRFKKALIYSGVVCGGLLVGFLLFFAAFSSYFRINPQAYVNFAAFKPTNSTVEDAKIAVYTPELVLFGARIDTTLFPTVRIEFRLKDQPVRVLQQKDNGFAYDCAQEFVERCQVTTSPRGIKYLIASDEFDQPTGYAAERVTFVKDGTVIKMLHDGSTQRLSETVWTTLIDSFEHTTEFTTLPVIKYHPGP